MSYQPDIVSHERMGYEVSIAPNYNAYIVSWRGEYWGHIPATGSLFTVLGRECELMAHWHGRSTVTVWG